MSMRSLDITKLKSYAFLEGSYECGCVKNSNFARENWNHTAH